MASYDKIKKDNRFLYFTVDRNIIRQIHTIYGTIMITIIIVPYIVWLNAIARVKFRWRERTCAI